MKFAAWSVIFRTVLQNLITTRYALLQSSRIHEGAVFLLFQYSFQKDPKVPMSCLETPKLLSLYATTSCEFLALSTRLSIQKQLQSITSTKKLYSQKPVVKQMSKSFGTRIQTTKLCCKNTSNDYRKIRSRKSSLSYRNAILDVERMESFLREVREHVDTDFDRAKKALYRLNQRSTK